MEWWEILLLTLGGSGGLLGAVSFLGQRLVEHRLDKDLKTFDARLAAAVRIKELQLPGYRELWEISSGIRSSDLREYEPAAMREAARRLRAWYYRDGNGALLSFRAQTLLQSGLTLLDAGAPADSAAVRWLFSNLRTQLKRDLGFYTDREAAAPLAVPQAIEEARRETRTSTPPANNPGR